MNSADPYYPDGTLPESVRQLMIQALQREPVRHYTHHLGYAPLRQAIARKVKLSHGLALDPEESILVTPGFQVALFFAMLPFLAEGDEVIVFEPCYPNYFINPPMLGATLRFVPLLKKNDYQPDISYFESLINEKTKMVILAQPNNPAATVYRKETLEAICRLIVEWDLILLSDQAFEAHIFEGVNFVSPAQLPGMWERTVAFGSLSKGLGFSGLRVGYLYADHPFMQIFFEHAETIMGPVSTVSSIAATAGLNDENLLSESKAYFLERKEMAERIFSDIPGVSLQPPQCGLIAWLNITGLGQSSQAVSDYILEKEGIVVSPGNHMGPHGEGYLRLVIGAYSDNQEMEMILQKIADALRRLAES